VVQADLSEYALRDGIFGTDSKMNRVRPLCQWSAGSPNHACLAQFVASPGALTPAQCAALLASPKSLAAAGSIAAGSEEGSE
jgi:hypothetical protein